MAHLSLASESWCHVLSGEHLIIKQGKTVVKPYYPYTHNYLNICPKMLFVGIPYILCHWEHLWQFYSGRIVTITYKDYQIGDLENKNNSCYYIWVCLWPDNPRLWWLFVQIYAKLTSSLISVTILKI